MYFSVLYLFSKQTNKTKQPTNKNIKNNSQQQQKQGESILLYNIDVFLYVYVYVNTCKYVHVCMQISIVDIHKI